MLLVFFLMVLVFKVNPDYWDVTLNHSLNPGLYLESKSIKNYKHCHTHTKKNWQRKNENLQNMCRCQYFAKSRAVVTKIYKHVKPLILLEICF